MGQVIINYNADYLGYVLKKPNITEHVIKIIYKKRYLREPVIS